MEKTENLMDGLFSEMKRVREELIPAYEEIGIAGQFGLIMLKVNIKTAEDAIKQNDVVKMLIAYNVLKECQ